MSRRLSKKSRATKLTTNVAFSAANLPKLDSSVLDALFARSPARKRNLRASLMVGTMLSAGVLTGVGVMIDASPAFAGCVPSGLTINCSGSLPTGIPPGGVTYLLVPTGATGTINVTTAKVGENAAGDGLGFVTGSTGQTLIVNTDAASTFGIGAGYGETRDGIHMYSHYTGTTLSVSNAAAITSGRDAIYTRINDGNERANDHIAIINTAQLNAGGDGIHAVIDASVPSNFVAINTIAITNSGQIGTSKSYAGNDGIYSLIVKTGFVPQPNNNPAPPASITGTNNQYNSKNIYSNFDGQYAGTKITDVAKGGGYATSGITNSGNVTSKFGNGLHAYALGGTAGGGSGTATVVISNTGTLLALSLLGSQGEGIHGFAKADTDYVGGGTTKSFTGGNSAATVSISNAGNMTTGNATNTGGPGIYGQVFATANGDNTHSAKGYSGTGGNATATVTITNGNATVLPVITTNGGAGDINGNATVLATGTGYAGQGGNASATTTLTNYGTLTIKASGGTRPTATCCRAWPRPMLLAMVDLAAMPPRRPAGRPRPL